ncbi:MAG: HlyD family efflux transporter periplasmic adaptor subunit [Lachnospiraceae bacterium]|nr:HlyD family efflux transporter periplasmic adaptor subunit [Lachnospiraceae bacterium]
MTRSGKKKGQLVKRIIIIVLVVAVVGTAGIIYLRQKVTDTFGSDEDTTALSAAVTMGSISTTVSGSGTLASDDAETVEIPSSITVSKLYVEEGDTVEEGDLIATVNSTSVISAMSTVQASIDAIDEEIEEASESEIADTITTSLAGRVKVIYAEEDDDVSTVMYENGVLMRISLDGYMSLEVTTDDLAKGDEVTVTDEDGTEYAGTVESVTDGVATVLVTDDGPVYGGEATVYDADGNSCGTGTFAIHSELKITGYAGTVDEVSVEEEDEVEAGDTLFTLTDTTWSASYDELLSERAELEETLAELIEIYKEGAVYAPIAGTVESVSDTSSSSSSSDAYSISMTTSGSSSTDASASSTATTLATIATNETMTISVSVDETDILSLEEGQSASVVISSISEDETFEGTVTAIDTEGTSSSGVTYYTATITVEKDSRMLSGMSATVSITIDGVEDALLIPSEAVTTTSSTAYVYTSYDETTGELGDMVEVTVGLDNGTYVEITDGLSEGDTVYYFEESDSTSDFSSMFGNMGGDMDFDSSGMDFSNMQNFDSSGSGGGMSMPNMGGGN